MAMSANIFNKINKVAEISGGDQQNVAPQPRSSVGLNSSSAPSPQTPAEIEPSTTKAGALDSASTHHMTALAATTLHSDTHDADAKTAEAVEPEAEWADEEWPGLVNYELIDDTEELAHNLVHSCLAPDCHPRIEALFQRAASGNGYHSQLIRASGLI